MIIPFTVGDWVQFTPEAMELCAPDITDDEVCGQVTFVNPFDEKVTVLFDDGATLTYPARYFEKFEPEEKSPIAS